MLRRDWPNLQQAFLVVVLASGSCAVNPEARAQVAQQPTATQQERGRLDASVGLDYVAEPIINPLGGLEQSGSLLQGLWLQLKLGSGLSIPKAAWRELDHWSVSTSVAVVRGNSNYYQQIGAAYPLQTMTASGQWLTDASLRRDAGKSKIALRAGVMTLNPEFMVSDAFNYFIHSAINDTFNEEVIGIPIAPLASPGFVLTYGDSNQAKIGQFKFGLFQIVASNQFGSALYQSAPPPALSGAVALLQWQKQLSWPTRKKQAEAGKITAIAVQLPAPNLMLGGYWSQTQAGVSGENTSPESIAQGQNRTLYGSITLPLARTTEGLSKGRLWLAGRVGLDWDNNPAPYFVGLGVLTQGLIAGRPLDVSGLALVSTGFSPTLNPGLSQESVIEFNHQIRISPRIGLKPFVQLILNPGGSGQMAPILAPGLQFSASL